MRVVRMDNVLAYIIVIIVTVRLSQFFTLDVSVKNVKICIIKNTLIYNFQFCIKKSEFKRNTNFNINNFNIYAFNIHSFNDQNSKTSFQIYIL